MRISQGLNLEGWNVSIPDCTRYELPEFFKELGYKVGAEIGVKEGHFSKCLCEAGLKIYSIDPWVEYSDYYFGTLTQNIDEQYEKTKALLEPLGATVIRKTSMEAVKDFKDESLDFVYIDGNHSFKYVTEDIFEWSKKVRHGGIIAGDDYCITISVTTHGHVKYVVDAYTRAFKIPKWYVIGSRDIVPGEKRDKWRSFFWFKQ